jgi:hypothetical protein
MAAAGSLPEICEDTNFKKLADSRTDAEEFSDLVKTRLVGYTQRKIVLDGIKELVTRVEAIDQKLVIAKAIGKKGGELDETQEYLNKHYTLVNLKEKSAFLNTSISATLDAGELTAEELEPTLQSLKLRLQKAKVDGKEKLSEKLERQIGVVSAAKPVSVPIAEIKDIFSMQQQLDEVQKLLLKPRKDLSAEEREKVKSGNKVQLELDIESAKARSHMWFETEEDFKRRLSKALEWYYAHLEEIKQQEIAAEQERKRLEAQAKEEQRWKDIEEKIEQKRLAALAAEKDLTPSSKKVAQKSKTKVVKKGTKVDAGHFFREPSKLDEDAWTGPEDVAPAPAPAEATGAAAVEVDAEDIYSAEEAAAAAEEAQRAEIRRAEEAKRAKLEAASCPASQTDAAATQGEDPPSEAAEPATEAQPVVVEEMPAPKPKPRPRPVEKESMWGKAAAPAFAPQDHDEDRPSLADSLKAPKKRAPVAAPVARGSEASQPSQPAATVDPEEIYAAEEAAAREAEEAEMAERLAAQRLGQAQAKGAPTTPEPRTECERAIEMPSPPKQEEQKVALAAAGEQQQEPVAPVADEAKVPQPKARPKPVEKESQWGQAKDNDHIADQLPSLGPSLADSLKAGPKKAGAQPKKKGAKKQFSKMSLGQLGFEYSDAGQPNHPDEGPSKWAAPDGGGAGE